MTKYMNVKNGIEILHSDGLTQILAGSGIPSEFGVEASIGSIFLSSSTSGTLYKKIGPDPLDWTPEIMRSSDISILNDEQIPDSIARTTDIITTHSGLSDLDDDNHPQYHTDARGDSRYYTQPQVDDLITSVSGVEYSFLDLTDTPSNYSEGRHLVSTASGIILEDYSVEYSLYVSPNYNGSYSDGTREHPFKTIQELAQHSYTTYTGIDEAVTIHCLPGIYSIDDTTFTQNPTTKAIVGTDPTTVIFKPTENLIGKSMLGAYVPLSLRNITIDGTDIPALRTTPGSVGYTVAEGNGNQIDITDCKIKGFYQNMVVGEDSNIYAKGLESFDTNINITVSSGSVFDADLCYLYNADVAHIHATADSEVYVEGTEIYSWETDTISGTGVWADGESYVELFGGTNLWGLEKNLRVEGEATLRVDNCVLEETGVAPGIYQGPDAELIIINSRAPLANEDIDINNPDGVYINSYDSTEGRTTLGKASDVDNTLFSVNIGLPTNPTFDYDSTSFEHKGLLYTNHTDGTKTIFGVQSTNEEVLNLINTKGSNAWNHGAYSDFYSDQLGALRGWRIGKAGGSAPEFVFKYMDTTLALQLNNDGTLQLNSGEKVNKILDEDNLDSNDTYALATQRSIRSYLTGNYYTSTALDAGQLDNRYYTKSEISTLSGTMNNKFLHVDGSKELTADWDAGSYEITAEGFNKGNTAVDLSSFANATGVLTGGTLSINTDPTKLDVASGTCLYVNMTERDNPYVETLTWPDTTVDSTISGIRSKWVGIYKVSDGLGGVVTDTSFTQLEKRTIAVLGRYWGNGTDTITGKGQYSTGAFNFAKTTEDLAYGLGSFNISGNEISAGDEVMKLDRSAGQAIRYGAKYSTNPTSPNVVDSTDQSNLSVYQYHLQGQNFTTMASGIDPDYYDNAGVKTAIPADNWSAQRVYYFPGSSNVHVVYGQCYHPTKSLAEDCIQKDTLVLNESILEGSILVAYLVLKQGCTDLSDSNQAEVIKSINGIPGLLTGKVNHGELGGLADDDHPQYLNESRGDSRYYTQNQINALTGSYVNTSGTTPLVGNWNAGDYEITAAGFNKGNTEIDSAIYANTTGLLDGGQISVNGSNPYMLDVASGTALYVSMADPTDPIVETISWPAQTISGALDGNFYKWIGVYRESEGQGSLVIDQEFSALERRTVTVLGKYWSTSSGTDQITNAASYSNSAFGNTKSAEDFIRSYGSINIYGNTYSASQSVAMTLTRTEGQAFRAGANKSAQPTSPNIYDSPTQASVPSYYYQISGDYNYEVLSEIEPDYYDVNGVKTEVPTDKWTVQRIYYFAVSNVTVMLWGQYYYDSDSLAYDGMFNDEFSLALDTVEGGILRGYIIIKQGCTDLTNTNECKIYEALGRDGLLPGISNHGQLGGLGDDDHPQYHNDARGDARYYTQNQINALTGSYVNTSGTTPLVGNWNAGDYRITADGFSKGNTDIELASFANITGVLTGGELSINVDPTKLDVASGTCVYVDMSDRTDPIVEILSWPDTTIDSNLSGIRSRWVGAYRTGSGTASITTDTEFTPLEKRTVAIIGRYWGDGTDTITGKGNYTTGAFNFGKSIEDLALALGSINITGNVISAGTESMKLSRSAGQALRFASGYSSSAVSPNIRDSVTQSNISSYQYHVQESTSTLSASGIDPNYYDNSGSKTAVPTDKWTTQRVYYFPSSSNVHIVYGQSYHDSYSLAYDDTQTTPVTLNEDILAGSILMAYLFLKQGCTDLTDTDQANIVPAILGEDRLLTAPSNHGELGGLQEDDHPHYHNDTRGDARYYTQTEIDTWRSENPHTASGIEYTNTSWSATNVEEILDDLSLYAEETRGTGRITPVTTISGVYTTTLNVNAGAGFINYSGFHSYITWEAENIDVSSYDEGVYYVSVDTNGDVNINTTQPNRGTQILLGFFYHSGTYIGMIQICGCMIDNSFNRVVEFIMNLGSFLTSDSGLIQTMPAEPLKITSGPCTIQYGTLPIAQPEVSSDDAGNTFFLQYKSVDDGWETDYHFFSTANAGKIYTDIWNDTTASGSITLPGIYTFTNGSSTVTTSSISPDIELGNTLFLSADGHEYMVPVSTISGNTITLRSDYQGTGGTGVTILDKALTAVDSGKWVKHLVLRSLDGAMHIIPSQAQFDSEEAASAAGSPTIPAAIEQANVKMANIVCSGTDTDVSDGLIDIRPLPFHQRDGGPQAGGAASDHGALLGLSDDDHTQYLLTNGSRDVTGKMSYNTHPTFGADTDIVDKKYVDDEIDNLTTDHGELTGLSDDDHSQYHNDTRGDARYLSKTNTDAFTPTGDYHPATKKYVDDNSETDHGSLNGLSDDDHTQYILVDGTRDLTNKLSYNSHPTFLNDVELVDKKYVDDEISVFTTDHGSLDGLSDDDHTQYHNDTRGDIRYYTKTQLNNGQLDNRYYTETEVDSLISSSVVTDHGNLTGILDDDHTIYTKADGSRPFSSKVSYSSHPTFISDTEIVDKKYVDDGLNNLTTDHGELTGLSDDDHSQYHNDTRGDIRYYTKTSLNAGQLDNRYYTETEVDSLISSSVVTDHGNLTGLGDDDHTIYSKSDGSRDFTGKVGYSSHPTFVSDTEIVDKKYVDDEISNLTTDHGGLTGLSDDDHPQYHNDTRGDARYYTQSQVDTAISNHHASSNTDHDDRYYTETEVDGLLTTLSGSIQSDIDDLVSGDLDACHIRRNTQITLASSWSPVTFNITDVENNTDILQHDDVNTERILIKESGLYQVRYQFNFSRTYTGYCYGRVLKNGSTLIEGTDTSLIVYTNELHPLIASVPVMLQENDYLTVELYESGTGSAESVGPGTFSVTALRGKRGEQGPAGADGEDGEPGTGSTVHIDQEDTRKVSGASILNFTGNVTVTDGGSGTADIDIAGGGNMVQCYSTDTSTNINNTTPVAISWNNEDLKDSYYTHSTTVNSSRLYVTENGWYEVSYNISYDTSGARTNVRGRVRKNGNTYLGRGTSVGYTRNAANGRSTVCSPPFLVQLNSNDYLEIMTDQTGDSTAAYMESADNFVRINFIR